MAALCSSTSATPSCLAHIVPKLPPRNRALWVSTSSHSLHPPGFLSKPPSSSPPKRLIVCSATQEKDQDTVDAVTRKFGLEAGLWKIFSSKDDGVEETSGKKGVQAKELLARYGGAYLATSISLSLVSFTMCYLLISAGVDVTSLLNKIGIHTNETGEKVGTLALAYAAHKAASPIRFPPTVALTPIVAGWFGKKVANGTEETDL